MTGVQTCALPICVAVVLEAAAEVAIVVDVVTIDQNVAGDVFVARSDEQAVAAVVERQAAQGDVLALLDIERGGVEGISFWHARAAGERVGRPRAANVQVFDAEVAGHGVRRIVCPAENATGHRHSA